MSDDNYLQGAMPTARETLTAKVQHVRARIGTPHRNHLCHWPGCKQQVHPAQWGCRSHWFRLPQRLRSKIWAAYRAGQEQTMTPSAAYVAAAREVEEWIHTSGGPV